jgi:hypothetical protein
MGFEGDVLVVAAELLLADLTVLRMRGRKEQVLRRRGLAEGGPV